MVPSTVILVFSFLMALEIVSIKEWANPFKLKLTVISLNSLELALMKRLENDPFPMKFSSIYMLKDEDISRISLEEGLVKFKVKFRSIVLSDKSRTMLEFGLNEYTLARIC